MLFEIYEAFDIKLINFFLKQLTAPKSFNSQFIKDVNIPDGTILAPQAKFEKTWKLSNNGRFPVSRCNFLI